MSPTLADLVQRAVRNGMASVHTSIPARVLTYDSALQKVTVEVVVDEWGKDRALVSLPPTANIPVMWASVGSPATASLTMPLPAGSPGYLVYCERSTDEWRESGVRTGLPPASARRHSSGDCWFIPGGRPFSDPIPADGVSATAVVLMAPSLLLGGVAGAAFVALATLVDARFAALKAALDTHIHPDPASGFTGAPTIPMPTAATVAATKVKAV